VRRQRSASLTQGQLQALPLQTAQLQEHFVGATLGTLAGPALESGGTGMQLGPQLGTSGERSTGEKSKAVLEGTLPGSDRGGRGRECAK